MKIICTICPKGCHLEVDEKNNYSVTGHDCSRGIEYGQNELKNPVRVITSTVKVIGAIHRRCPVKTKHPIPKKLIAEAMQLLNDIELVAPVDIGQIIIKDICGTGIPFVTTRSLTI